MPRDLQRVFPAHQTTEQHSTSAAAPTRSAPRRSCNHAPGLPCLFARDRRRSPCVRGSGQPLPSTVALCAPPSASFNAPPPPVGSGREQVPPDQASEPPPQQISASPPTSINLLEPDHINLENAPTQTGLTPPYHDAAPELPQAHRPPLILPPLNVGGNSSRPLASYPLTGGLFHAQTPRH